MTPTQAQRMQEAMDASTLSGKPISQCPLCDTWHFGKGLCRRCVAERADTFRADEIAEESEHSSSMLGCGLTILVCVVLFAIAFSLSTCQ